MDLVNAAIDLKQADLASQIQFAVARKLLDSQKLAGNAAVKLIEAADNATSKAGDQMTTAAIGLGSEIDVYG